MTTPDLNDARRLAESHLTQRVGWQRAAVAMISALADALERQNAALAKYEADDVRYLAELERLRAQVSTWESELSAVMPADFKDWHENSRAEWPAVAAAVIRSLRAGRDRGWDVAARAQVAPDPETEAQQLFSAAEFLRAVWSQSRWTEDEIADRKWKIAHELEQIGNRLMTVPAAPAQQAETSAAAVLPEFIRRDVEQAIHAAEHPKGMSTHDGMARVGADRLRYLLRAWDAKKEPTHD